MREEAGAAWGGWSIALGGGAEILVRADGTSVSGRDRSFDLVPDGAPWTEPVLWLPAERGVEYDMHQYGGASRSAEWWNLHPDVEGARATGAQSPVWDVQLLDGTLVRVRADAVRKGKFGRYQSTRDDRIDEIASLPRRVVRSISPVRADDGARRSLQGELGPGASSDRVLDALQDSMDRRDRALLARAVELAEASGVTLAHLHVLCVLHSASWHSSHAQLADLLRRLPGDDAARVLQGVVRSMPSLAIGADGARSIVRSSIAALSVLTGAEATRVLRRLGESDLDLVRSEARIHVR